MNPTHLKRVYAAPAASDGTRVLVDRLWPRGLTKARARVDLWLKDLSPSDALRREAHAEPEQWENFVREYAAELKDAKAAAAVAILQDLIAKGPVTLLYAAHDEARNNAVALAKILKLRD